MELIVMYSLNQTNIKEHCPSETTEQYCAKVMQAFSI